MEHRELRQLLDAMIRSAKLAFEQSGNVNAFAMRLNEQGRIAQLAFPQGRDRSTEEMSKCLEAGLGAQ